MLARSIRSPKKQRRLDPDMKESSDSSSSAEISTPSSDNVFSTPPRNTTKKVPHADAQVAAYLQGFNDISYATIKHLIAPPARSKDRLFLPSSYQPGEHMEKYILRLKTKGLLLDHRVDAVEEKVEFVGQKWPISSESSREKAMATAKRVEGDLLRELHVVNVRLSQAPGPIRR
ncbi:hypothetical protein LTR86_000483 [Recurvomyces mirabilis]|nr:hypothetical protein LTR86_000483 [Recurvomyces mirabilis]